MLLYLILFMQILFFVFMIFIFLFSKNQFDKEIIKKREISSLEKTVENIIQEIENIINDYIFKIEEKMKDIDNKILNFEKMMKEVEEIKLQFIADKIKKETEKTLFEKSNLFQKSLSPRQNKIYELADQGWDIIDIAREIKAGKGEVQLILDLRKEEKK